MIDLSLKTYFLDLKRRTNKEGRPHGRPPSARLHTAKIHTLFYAGASKRQIAAQLKISRSSVRRLLESKPRARSALRVRKHA
ncbi:MAG: helix-turn-helix domain-containing protein [Steroidobacteraceae bacterium]